MEQEFDDGPSQGKSVEDIYSERDLLMEDDEVSLEEEGFMDGWERAWEDVESLK